MKEESGNISNILKETVSLGAVFAESIKPFYSDLSTKLVNSLNEVINSNLQHRTLGIINREIVAYNADCISTIVHSFFDVIQSIDFTPLYSVFSIVDNSSTSNDYLKRIVLKEMYKAHWWPHSLCIGGLNSIMDFWDIINSTKESKNRTQKIDKLIFKIYNKKMIEGLLNNWRRYDIPNYMLRMMRQGVQAFFEKEYAVTVIVLSTLWEWIIYEKTGDNSGKKTKKTKDNYCLLVTHNGFCQRETIEFFNDFLFYDCRSVKEVKDDVPGRNSIAHGWYNSYPSRKAALNAIVFTDFLINLKPMVETELYIS